MADLKEIARLPAKFSLQDCKDAFIFEVLRSCSFNRTRTSLSLGISRRGLFINIERMKKLGYKIPDSPDDWRKKETVDDGSYPYVSGM